MHQDCDSSVSPCAFSSSSYSSWSLSSSQCPSSDMFSDQDAHGKQKRKLQQHSLSQAKWRKGIKADTKEDDVFKANDAARNRESRKVAKDKKLRNSAEFLRVVQFALDEIEELDSCKSEAARVFAGRFQQGYFMKIILACLSYFEISILLWISNDHGGKVRFFSDLKLHDVIDSANKRRNDHAIKQFKREACEWENSNSHKPQDVMKDLIHSRVLRITTLLEVGDAQWHITAILVKYPQGKKVNFSARD